MEIIIMQICLNACHQIENSIFSEENSYTVHIQMSLKYSSQYLKTAQYCDFYIQFGFHLFTHSPKILFASRNLMFLSLACNWSGGWGRGLITMIELIFLKA